MSNSLAIRDDMPLSELGNVLVRSGFFTDATDASKAIVKVLAGRELGFGPIASMTGFYIVKGRVSMSANLMASAIKRTTRYNYRVIKHTDAECEIAFFENGEEVGRSLFTAADAKRAGTQNMERFPRNMLFARAMSNGAKWFCPDIFGGPVYTPEELGAVVNEDGEPIEGVIVTTPNPAPQPAQVQPDPTPGKAGRPYPPETVRDAIAKKAANHPSFVPNDGQRGLLRHALDLCFVGEDPAVVEDKRHILLRYLTGKPSTSDVSGPVFKAILEDWLKANKDSGEYVIDPMAAAEAQMIVGQALLDESQKSLGI